MNTPSTTPGRTLATPTAPRRRVVDAPTRMFHWLFATSFAGAYLTAESEHWRALHVALGYTLAALLGFRVLYGLFGPRPARLGVLARKLAGTGGWLRAMVQALQQASVQAAPWRQGQHLVMAAAVAALLVLALPLVLSGYAAYQEWDAALGGELFAEVHEALGEAMLAVVFGHVALIAVLSAVRRRNQALPMLTGCVEGSGVDLVKHDRRRLAGLLLVGAVAVLIGTLMGAPPIGSA